MTPEANDALHRIKKDYPAVQHAQDAPNTVYLWFDHIKAFVTLVGEELDPPHPLDEAGARSALDALLGVTSAPEPAADVAIEPTEITVTPAAKPEQEAETAQ